MISHHSYLVYTYEQQIFIDEIQVYSRRHIQLSSIRAHSGGQPNIFCFALFHWSVSQRNNALIAAFLLESSTTNQSIPNNIIYSPPSFSKKKEEKKGHQQSPRLKKNISFNKNTVILAKLSKNKHEKYTSE
jgi:hypothetical protein